MRKIILTLILSSICTFSWSQYGMCSPKKEIVFLGIRLGSGGHMFTTKVAEVINMNVPEVSATVMTGSSKENLINVQRKKGDIAFTSSNYLRSARAGEGAYKGMACKDLMFYHFFVITLDNFLVRADSGIRKIEELKDKKINLGPKGYSLTEIGLAVLKAYGLSPETIRKNGGSVSFASGKDACKMIQDKIVDAIFAHSGKSAVISYNLAAEKTVGLRPLHYDRGKLETVKKILNWGVIMEIDGGVYKAEPNPVESIGTAFVFGIHKDVPADIVYKMVKATFEHQKEIRDAMGPFYNPFKIQNALVGSEGIPVHPGALRYYKEIGIIK